MTLNPTTKTRILSAMLLEANKLERNPLDRKAYENWTDYYQILNQGTIQPRRPEILVVMKDHKRKIKIDPLYVVIAIVTAAIIYAYVY